MTAVQSNNSAFERAGGFLMSAVAPVGGAPVASPLPYAPAAYAKLVGSNFELMIDALTCDIVVDPVTRKCVILQPHMGPQRPLFRIQYNKSRGRFELVTALLHIVIDGVPSTAPMVPLPLSAKSLVDLNGIRFYFLLPIQANVGVPVASSSPSPSGHRRTPGISGRLTPANALATLATAAAGTGVTTGPLDGGVGKPEKGFPELIMETFEYNKCMYLDADTIISTIRHLYPYYRNAQPKELEVPVKLTLTAQKKFHKSNTSQGKQMWSLAGVNKQQASDVNIQAVSMKREHSGQRTKGVSPGSLPGVDRQRKRTGKEFVGTKGAVVGRQREILKHYSFLSKNYTVLPPLDPN